MLGGENLTILQASFSWNGRCGQPAGILLAQEGELRLRVLPAAVSRKPFSYKLTAGPGGTTLAD